MMFRFKSPSTFRVASPKTSLCWGLLWKWKPFVKNFSWMLWMPTNMVCRELKLLEWMSSLSSFMMYGLARPVRRVCDIRFDDKRRFLGILRFPLAPILQLRSLGWLEKNEEKERWHAAFFCSFFVFFDPPVKDSSCFRKYLQYWHFRWPKPVHFLKSPLQTILQLEIHIVHAKSP